MRLGLLRRVKFVWRACSPLNSPYSEAHAMTSPTCDGCTCSASSANSSSISMQLAACITIEVRLVYRAIATVDGSLDQS